jgi:hypothetical protein
VLRSVRHTGNVIAYVEIMGVLRVGGVYGKVKPGPGALIEHLYVYDLDAQRDRTAEFRINRSVFEARDWATEGLEPSEQASLSECYEKAAREVWEPRYRARSAPANPPSGAV